MDSKNISIAFILRSTSVSNTKPPISKNIMIERATFDE